MDNKNDKTAIHNYSDGNSTPGASSAHRDVPLVYACSGCSDAGELADQIARRLSREGLGEMSCIAGIGGRVKPLLVKAYKARRVIVIDGCPLTCAAQTMKGAGFADFEHVKLHELGHKKGNCPVTDERVEEAVEAVKEQIEITEPAA